MNASDILREFLYPARNVTVWLSALFIFLMLEFAAFGRLLGLFLAFLMLPSLFNFLARILDARAKGQEPGPLEVDDLLWYHRAWSLFMVVHIAISIYAVYVFGRLYGLPGAIITTALLAAVLPASLATLAITKSPLQSLDPRAITGVIGRTGGDYWILPTFILAAVFVIRVIAARDWPDFVVEMIAFYLVLVFFSLTGAVVAPHHLHDEVEIHEPVEKSQEVLDAALLKERTAVLNHAYGFVSRGNRAGGFRHIESWLNEDPDPRSAWEWFFQQMLRWENRDAALVFAQSYLGRLLGDGDSVAAVKVMMRCRLENERFVPLAADLALAVAAAEACGNQELAGFLRSRV